MNTPMTFSELIPGDKFYFRGSFSIYQKIGKTTYMYASSTVYKAEYSCMPYTQVVRFR